MAKTLVAYFSASGTTAKVAKDLAAATRADLFEIAPEQPYSRADLNWNDKGSRSSVEMNDESRRPAIAGVVADMEACDTVYVGFPVWWYVEPRIIDTFLEAYDFAGKTVVPSRRAAAAVWARRRSACRRSRRTRRCSRADC